MSAFRPLRVAADIIIATLLVGGPLVFAQKPAATGPQLPTAPADARLLLAPGTAAPSLVPLALAASRPASPAPVVLIGPPPAPPGAATYLGIGVDDMDAAQYEAAGTSYDWGRGAGPGGGMLISFVDPECELRWKGALWGDILVAIDAGKGGPRRVANEQDVEQAVSQLAPGTEAALHVFKRGQVQKLTARPTAWPAKAQQIWPDRRGRGPFYFPWYKDRPALVEFRVNTCRQSYGVDHDPLALKDLADTYFFTARYAEALKAYEAYFTANPNAAGQYPARYAQAYSARMTGQWEKARSAAEEALSANPRSYLALYELAHDLYQLGDQAGALNCINNAIQLLPPGADAMRQSFEGWRSRVGIVAPRSRYVPAAPATPAAGVQAEALPEEEEPASPPPAAPRSASTKRATPAPRATATPKAKSSPKAPPTPKPSPSATPRPATPIVVLPPMPAPSSATPEPVPTLAPVSAAAPTAPTGFAFPARAGAPASAPAALFADSIASAPQGPSLAIESLECLLAAHPGSTVLAALQYRVGGLNPGGKAPVVETLRVKKKDETFQRWTQTNDRVTDRSYDAKIMIAIPANLPPGDYELEATVRSGGSQAQKTIPLKVHETKQ
ncbi:MAG: hypothetical protein NTW86_24625 [Candidatus Sumerlaeota bacterium]|nr:hypothetical protein [Candidatus Sumerlaeota bacterium]